MATTLPLVKVVREGRLPVPSRTVAHSSDAAAILGAHLAGADREHFVALYLNAKNVVMAVQTVSIGILDECLVHPREVFKTAILLSASAVIVGHNHPSGDPTPSAADRAVTDRLRDAGRLLGIDLLDSLVVTDDGRYTSLGKGA